LTPRVENPVRARFITEAARIGPIELELAATAAYLHTVDKMPAAQAWKETARRKPEKARDNRLAAAQEAYRKLRALATPKQLPGIV
jgi:hypothetical protein